MKDQQNNSPLMEGGKRAERLQIMITDEELAALDTWRFGARMPSRSAAVRELIRRGLAAEGFFKAAEKNNQSSSYGILKNEP
jgi:metal-responsive CopG/Arc/MetJ family transcriptional regulator